MKHKSNCKIRREMQSEATLTLHLRAIDANNFYNFFIEVILHRTLKKFLIYKIVINVPFFLSGESLYR